MSRLRPFQTSIKAAVYQHWNDGRRNVLVKSPTGSGKTVITADIVREVNCAVASIAHRSELVTQKSIALAREGIAHRVIGPDSLRKDCVTLHMEEFRRSFYNPSARVGVCSVDTLIGRKNDPWLHQVGLWDMDECFPAGTLIDGRPIEQVKVGDHVTAFDESTGLFATRRVVRLFKNPAPQYMVRLTIGHHMLKCTLSHPIYTRRGWVPAASLRSDDEMFYVRESCRGPQRGLNGDIQENGTGLLRKGLLQSIPSEAVFGDDAIDQPEVRVGQDEGKQPHVPTGGSRESIRLAEGEGASPENSRRERKAPDASRGGVIFDVSGFGLSPAGSSENGVLDRERDVPPLLQARLGEQGAKVGGRSRREQPRRQGPQSSGHEERRLPEWIRLDRVEIYQRGNIGNAGAGCDDGFVYNFEVEDWHTYLAEGFVVHNCHHVLRENKWGQACEMFPNARGLGVTATPARADGRGLGSHADGVFEGIVQGPELRELIDSGYLTDYRIFAPPSDVDYSEVTVTASGDYSPAKLRAAVHASDKIVGDVVRHYQRIAPGKLGVTFAVDIEAAKEISAAFNAAGVPSEIVSAKTPAMLRSQILRRFKNRQVLQLVNVDLFGEGFDLPAIEVVSMVRKTESWPLFVQQFGRALRLMIPADLSAIWGTLSDEERRAHIAASGKPVALIIDHVGNVIRHGLPDAPRLDTLDRRERRSAAVSDAVPVRSCANENASGTGIPCASIYPRFLKVCPYCGFYPEPAARSAPEFVDGDLFELDPETLAAMRGKKDAIDGAPRIPQSLDPMAARGVMNRHHERQQAQHALRETIALWAGWQQHQGRDDSQSYRVFFHTFGLDVLSAQSLGRPDAEALTLKIRTLLDRNGVIPA